MNQPILLEFRKNDNGLLGKKQIPLFLLFLLCSAAVNNGYGTTELEIIYPSDDTRDCYTWDDFVAVEGTECKLKIEKANNDSEPQDYSLQILDKDRRKICHQDMCGDLNSGS